MVVKLDAQTSLDPFGLPWSARHARRPDEGPGLGNSNKSRYFRISASAPTSPPSVFQVLKSGGGGSGGAAGTASSSGSTQGLNHAGSRLAGSGPRLAKIQVELQPCRPFISTASSLSPTEVGSRPRPKKTASAPLVLQSRGGGGDGEEEEEVRSSNPPFPSRVDESPAARPRTPLATSTAVRGGEGKGAPVFRFPRSSSTTPSTLTLRPAKRGRALHDVDGPGTGALSCKKRRLRLHLVTSRLSQPYSWPATHILNRESGDDTPVLSRFLKFAAMGALKKAGHQSAMVRKAAILNRVRIGVRQAAVLRGHTVIAGMAARGNSLSHGLQLVTTSNNNTAAKFPGLPPLDYPMPPAWRPHTTAFHISPPSSSPPDRGFPASNRASTASAALGPATTAGRSSSLVRPSAPIRAASLSPQAEDDDGVAFPSPDLETRYADLSDDDLDDVYADFGVLFGSGARSPEGGSGNGDASSGDHFYEEYLDELDGIRWVA
ncbi:hypothetical protein GGS26DRAFT_589161 [Hypomontagnella submonticulosa]|nr:hypothetical protein GGS26DRAFT_589161 [Hypomontagnella submonticulosa]